MESPRSESLMRNCGCNATRFSYDDILTEKRLAKALKQIYYIMVMQSLMTLPRFHESATYMGKYYKVLLVLVIQEIHLVPISSFHEILVCRTVEVAISQHMRPRDVIYL